MARQLKEDTVYGGRVYLCEEPDTPDPRKAPPGKAFNTDGDLVDLPEDLETTEEVDEDEMEIPPAVKPTPSEKDIPPYFPKANILMNEDNGIETFGDLEEAMEGDKETRAENLSENVKGLGKKRAGEVVDAYDATDL